MDDHRQKYVEITKNCLGIEIADKHLRFLQTKHLQCRSRCNSILEFHKNMTPININDGRLVSFADVTWNLFDRAMPIK